MSITFSDHRVQQQKVKLYDPEGHVVASTTHPNYFDSEDSDTGGLDHLSSCPFVSSQSFPLEENHDNERKKGLTTRGITSLAVLSKHSLQQRPPSPRRASTPRSSSVGSGASSRGSSSSRWKAKSQAKEESLQGRQGAEVAQLHSSGHQQKVKNNNFVQKVHLEERKIISTAKEMRTSTTNNNAVFSVFQRAPFLPVLPDSEVTLNTTSPVKVLNAGENRRVKSFIRVRPLIQSEVIAFYNSVKNSDDRWGGVERSGGPDALFSNATTTSHNTSLPSSFPLTIRSDNEISQSISCVSVGDDGMSIKVGNDIPCTFDGIFDPSTSLDYIVSQLNLPLLNDILNGYHTSILFFGNTTSGKTYTFNQLLPPLVNLLFENIAENKEEYETEVFLEAQQLYLECLSDMLTSVVVGEKRGSQTSSLVPPGADLQIREFPDTGIFVKGTTIVPIHSAEEFFAVWNRASGNRAVAAIDLNQHSSRSHCILTLSAKRRKLVKREQFSVLGVSGVNLNNDDDGINETNNDHDISSANLLNITEGGTIPTVTVGKISFIDLAGSERLKTTGSTGKRRTEAIAINLSLTTLGKVMNALADIKATHIPFRDSKLTRLLQESLVGGGSSCLVTTISPYVGHISETKCSLAFAMRTMSVVQRVTTWKEVDGKARMMEIQDWLESRVHALEAALRRAEEDKALRRNVGAIKNWEKQKKEEKMNFEQKMKNIEGKMECLDCLNLKSEIKEREIKIESLRSELESVKSASNSSDMIKNHPVHKRIVNDVKEYYEGYVEGIEEQLKVIMNERDATHADLIVLVEENDNLKKKLMLYEEKFKRIQEENINSNNVKHNTNVASSTMTAISVEHIQDIESKLSKTEKELKIAKESLKEMVASLAASQQVLQGAQENLATQGATIDDLRHELEATLHKKNNTETQFKNILREKDDFARQLSLIGQEHQMLITKMKTEYDSQLAASSYEVNSFQKQLQKALNDALDAQNTLDSVRSQAQLNAQRSSIELARREKEIRELQQNTSFLEHELKDSHVTAVSEGIQVKLREALTRAIEEASLQSDRLHSLQLEHSEELRALEVRHTEQRNKLLKELEMVWEELRKTREELTAVKTESWRKEKSQEKMEEGRKLVPWDVMKRTDEELINVKRELENALTEKGEVIHEKEKLEKEVKDLCEKHGKEITELEGRIESFSELQITKNELEKQCKSYERKVEKARLTFSHKNEKIKKLEEALKLLETAKLFADKQIEALEEKLKLLYEEKENEKMLQIKNIDGMRDAHSEELHQLQQHVDIATRNVKKYKKVMEKMASDFLAVSNNVLLNGGEGQCVLPLPLHKICANFIKKNCAPLEHQQRKTENVKTDNRGGTKSIIINDDELLLFNKADDGLSTLPHTVLAQYTGSNSMQKRQQNFEHNDSNNEKVTHDYNGSVNHHENSHDINGKVKSEEDTDFIRRLKRQISLLEEKLQSVVLLAEEQYGLLLKETDLRHELRLRDGELRLMISQSENEVLKSELKKMKKVKKEKESEGRSKNKYYDTISSNKNNFDGGNYILFQDHLKFLQEERDSSDRRITIINSQNATLKYDIRALREKNIKLMDVAIFVLLSTTKRLNGNQTPFILTEEGQQNSNMNNIISGVNGENGEQFNTTYKENLSPTVITSAPLAMSSSPLRIKTNLPLSSYVTSPSPYYARRDGNEKLSHDVLSPANSYLKNEIGVNLQRLQCDIRKLGEEISLAQQRQQDNENITMGYAIPNIQNSLEKKNEYKTKEWGGALLYNDVGQSLYDELMMRFFEEISRWQTWRSCSLSVRASPLRSSEFAQSPSQESPGTQPQQQVDNANVGLCVGKNHKALHQMSFLPLPDKIGNTCQTVPLRGFQKTQKGQESNTLNGKEDNKVEKGILFSSNSQKISPSKSLLFSSGPLIVKAKGQREKDVQRTSTVVLTSIPVVTWK